MITGLKPAPAVREQIFFRNTSSKTLVTSAESINNKIRNFNGCLKGSQPKIQNLITFSILLVTRWKWKPYQCPKVSFRSRCYVINVNCIGIEKKRRREQMKAKKKVTKNNLKTKFKLAEKNP